MGLARGSVMVSARCGDQGRDRGNSCWACLLRDDSCVKGRVQDSVSVSRELLQATWHAHPLSDSRRRLQGLREALLCTRRPLHPKPGLGRLDSRTWGAGPSRSCESHIELGFRSQGCLPPSRAGCPHPAQPVRGAGRGMHGMTSGRTSPGGVWPAHAPAPALGPALPDQLARPVGPAAAPHHVSTEIAAEAARPGPGLPSQHTRLRRQRGSSRGDGGALRDSTAAWARSRWAGEGQVWEGWLQAPEEVKNRHPENLPLWRVLF